MIINTYQNNPLQSKRYKAYWICSLYFISVFSNSSLLAQEVAMLNFNTNDGLPSNECYDLSVDEYNRIWISTDRGLCVYDGYEFKNFSTLDGLTDNTNFEIFENPIDGTRWLGSYDGTISILKDGKVSPWKWNDLLLTKTKGKWIKHLSFCENKTMIFVYKNNLSYFIFDHEKQIIEEYNIKDHTLDFTIDQKITFDFCGQEFYWYEQAFSVDCIRNATGDILISKLNNVVLDKNLDTISYSQQPDFVYENEEGEILIATNRGIEIYDKGTLENKGRILSNYRVSSIVQDREHNFWVSTIENGIFKIPNMNMKVLVSDHIKGHRLRGFGKSEDDRLFLKDINERVYFFEFDNQQFPTLRVAISNYFRHKDYLSYHSSGNQIAFYPGGYGHNFEATDGITMSPGEVGFTLQNKNKQLIYNSKNIATSKITSLDKIESGFLVGSMNGLYRLSFSPLAQEEFLSKIDSLDFRISDIQKCNSTIFLIASLGHGLFGYDVIKNHLFPIEIETEERFSSYMINTMYLENDTLLWLGTTAGLNKVKLRSEPDGSLRIDGIQSYTMDDGLASDFISDITGWQDHLWIAYEKGVQYFKPSHLQKDNPPPILILDSLVNISTGTKVENNSRLSHDENNLEVKYKGICYDKPSNAKFYRYKLSKGNSEGDWQYTDNTSVRFTNLDYGHYKIELQARNRNGIYSIPVQSQFHLSKHYAETIWFRGLVLISLFGLGYKYYKYRENRNRQKLLIKDISLQLKAAELEALRSQMNPHFIFNSLNSIQNFIFKHQVEKANYYLSMFAMLIRKSLEYSKAEHIRLSEEIHFLEEYVELEKMRFGHEFTFEIKSDHLHAEDLLIPPLILQPVIENSIKHGFKNIDFKGKINLSFTMIEDQEILEIIVEDNGAHYQEKSTTRLGSSLGLKLIEKRLNLNFKKKPDREVLVHCPKADESGYITTLLIPLLYEA